MPTFDYVVIGSGSAGSIVAGRLAAGGQNSVLLLEAGGDASAWPQIEDPTQINCLYAIPQIHWGYKSTPQVNMNDRVMDVWRAKLTGGCTSHNDMVYVRGPRADYDQWATEYGCSGWAYDDVRGFFEAAEAMLQPTTTTRNAFGAAFVDACVGLGFPYNPNYNSGGDMFGVSPLQSTIDRYFRRTTSYDRYVVPLLHDHPNLEVMTNALVLNIQFDACNRADAVLVSVAGVVEKVQVAREVILCAGAINSPQILVRSGIGNADAIRRLGGTVVADLPGVGMNLMDALIFLGTWSSRIPIENQPVNEGYAIVWADMNEDGQAALCAEMMRGHYTCEEPDPQNYYSVTGDMMRLQSRGSVTVTSLDPAAAPVIDMNFLSAPGDYDQCYAGFQLMREIGNSPGLWEWRGKELDPGPAVSTPDEIRQWILNNAGSLSHPVGTCAMGVGGMAVVDPELRVYGVSGLRVVDVSIMPRITAGHTQGPAFMIGEKGAALILAGG